MGPFTQELCDDAMKNGWLVLSVKKDWGKIFTWRDVLALPHPLRGDCSRRCCPGKFAAVFLLWWNCRPACVVAYTIGVYVVFRGKIGRVDT
ncbi:hypothetical protein MES4922_300052 [Mesorhizobium ventifaucium]|uniref:Uncharacterized protein n=1 Tax=Mesorhizobium ventifaucium TaxID=666020 RepID=A0ABN8JXT5_9HYPH|nr:hypothetical protein MES4922_300052 [Mesorhizobium ventifaucium]